MRGNVYKLCNCRDAETGKKLGRSCPRLDTKGHGQWWGRFTAPAGADGKRRRPWIGPFHTRKQAEDALATEVSKVAAGKPATDRTLKVGPYLDRWLDGKVDLKRSTFVSYEEAVRLYLKPGLGHLRLVELRDHHIAGLYAAMRQLNTDAEQEPTEMLRRLVNVRAPSEAKNRAEQARKSRKPLGPSRIKRVHAVLSSALGDAVASKLVEHNPATSVTLPRVRRAKPIVWTDERVARWRETGAAPGRVMVWTPTQTGAFLDHIADHRLYPLFHLIAYRGLRRAEAVGLPWSEVDLWAGFVTIRETRPDGDDETDDTKSEAGDRIVALDAGTVAVLKRWRTTQTRERLAWGGAYTRSGLVFTHEDGRPLRPEYVSERFDTWVRQTGLPPIHLHALRHGTATLLLAAGLDMKIVSDTLGHSKTSFTSDTYAAVVPEVASAAAEAGAAMVPRTGRQTT